MIAKTKRIQKKQEISRLLKARLCVYGDFFNLKVTKNNLSQNRLLVVVSKKIFKKANKRNRVKRCLMHVFDNVFFKKKDLQNNLSPNFQDFFLSVKKQEILKLSHTDLTKIVEELFLRYLQEKERFKNKIVGKINKSDPNLKVVGQKLVQKKKIFDKKQTFKNDVETLAK